MTSYVKDPDATLDYKCDWTAWMTTGDTIATSEWIAQDGIDIADDSHDTTTATVWLSGGAVRGNYKVTNRITTVEGRTDDRTLTINVRER